MQAVIQRVSSSSVIADGVLSGQIGQGLVILLGVAKGDEEKDAELLAAKIAKLRIFSDENGKMNLSLKAVNGKILSISQFTLYADTKDGNRPAFIKAMNPVEASKLYDLFNEELRTYDIEVLTGQFGADMKINLLNDGPVTIIYDENL